MTKCDCQIYEHCPVCNPTFFEQKMKTLILNDEVEFDLSEQHGLIVRLRSREYRDCLGAPMNSRRDRAPSNEQVACGVSDAVIALPPRRNRPAQRVPERSRMPQIMVVETCISMLTAQDRTCNRTDDGYQFYNWTGKTGVIANLAQWPTNKAQPNKSDPRSKASLGCKRLSASYWPVAVQFGTRSRKLCLRSDNLGTRSAGWVVSYGATIGLNYRRPEKHRGGSKRPHLGSEGIAGHTDGVSLRFHRRDSRRSTDQYGT